MGTSLKSYTEVRRDLKQVLDDAERGRPVGVDRRGRRVAMVDADGLRDALLHSRDLPQPVAISEAGGWSLLLPGVPVAADGSEFDEAVAELIGALREYVEDWAERLYLVPNHARHWTLIQFVAFSSDDQLASWIRAASG